MNALFYVMKAAPRAQYYQELCFIQLRHQQEDALGNIR